MGNLLVPFKKFLSNKNTVTILGVLLGIVVLYFGYTWRINSSVSPVKIPYANTTLIQGTKITEDVVSYTEVPKDLLNNMSNVQTNINQIVGQLVSFDAKIPVNSYFFSESLISEDEMPDSIFSNIPDGYTIFSLKVDNHSTYANSIFPDDTIDLYIYTQYGDRDAGEEEKPLFGRFITSIQVLAVKDGKGQNVFRNKDDIGDPEELLFAVPEDLFLLLNKAIKLGVEITPVPRNQSYSEHACATEVTNDFLEQIILEQTYQIPGECTDLTQC
jgi:hypothetical protein